MKNRKYDALGLSRLRCTCVIIIRQIAIVIKLRLHIEHCNTGTLLALVVPLPARCYMARLIRHTTCLNADASKSKTNQHKHTLYGSKVDNENPMQWRNFLILIFN